MWFSKKKYNDLLYRIAVLEHNVDYLRAQRNKEKEQILTVCPNGCTRDPTWMHPSFDSEGSIQSVGSFLVCHECGQKFFPLYPLSLKELTLLAYGYTEIKEVDDD